MATSYHAVLKHPWYDIGGRKYIDLFFGGHVRRVKVPFRYNRVMCTVSGITPVQALTMDTSVECTIETVDGYYVLKSIRPLE